MSGSRDVPFFVVVKRELRASDAAETLVVTHGAGQFSGEANLLPGRRAMARTRVTEPGEVIELSREQLLALVQSDAELSEILMRAFLLRRLELIARDLGDVVLIGSMHSAGTLRVREFLTRNGHRFHYIDLDRDPDAQALLDQFHVSAADVPVLIGRDDAVLRNPTNPQIAESLGFNDAIDQSHVRDLVIVGAGPAGLAGRSIRRLRRPRCARARIELAWGPGRLELTHRKLSRVSDGQFNTPTVQPPCSGESAVHEPMAMFGICEIGRCNDRLTLRCRFRDDRHGVVAVVRRGSALSRTIFELITRPTSFC